MKPLKDKKIIDRLFIEGKKIYTPSINVRFLICESQVLISVPTRIFKRAVDRNKVKRLIRESLKDIKNNDY